MHDYERTRMPTQFHGCGTVDLETQPACALADCPASLLGNVSANCLQNWNCIRSFRSAKIAGYRSINADQDQIDRNVAALLRIEQNVKPAFDLLVLWLASRIKQNVGAIDCNQRAPPAGRFRFGLIELWLAQSLQFL